MNDPVFNMRPNRQVTGFTLSWLLWSIVILVVVSVVGGALAWGLGWISVPGQVLSPQNVQEQWRFAYAFDESLQAIAQQVCATEKALAGATNENEQTQRRSQLLAYEQNYARVAAEYDARLRNAFQAGLVAPSDVPRRAPTLNEMKLRMCTR